MILKHIPVLSDEIVSYVSQTYSYPISFLDCTLGCGGHAFEIINNTNVSYFHGIDRDMNAIKEAKTRLDGVLKMQHKIQNIEYSKGCKILEKQNKKFDVILMDLGLSSLQLDDPNRGFSFKFKNSKLDMRMDENDQINASKFLEKINQKDLAQALKEHEVPFPQKTAERIINYRNNHKIETVDDLLKAVSFMNYRNKRTLPPATLLFQALRICINNELENLKNTLNVITKIMNKNGSLIVISFHSLEDRIVKHTIKENCELKSVNKKPILPSYKEQIKNRRSKSAKMRIAIKE